MVAQFKLNKRNVGVIKEEYVPVHTKPSTAYEYR